MAGPVAGTQDGIAIYTRSGSPRDAAIIQRTPAKIALITTRGFKFVLEIGRHSVPRTRNMYVGPLGDWPQAWTGFAYHGNGVAMGTYTGRLLAALACGSIRHSDLPAVMRGPLRRFPLPTQRLLYLRAAYAWFDLVDRFV